MADNGYHARLSPSGAEGWLNCVGWENSEGTNKYAAEGTAAHEVAAMCLRDRKSAEAYRGRVIAVDEWEFEVDDEMIEAVDEYVDYVLRSAGSVLPSGEYALLHTLMVETDVPIDHLTEEEDATGCSDAIVLMPGELQVHDLKYGRGNIVYAEKNKQMMMYASGAVRVISDLVGEDQVPERIRMVIHQPRINHRDEWECSLEDLRNFEKVVRHVLADEDRIITPGEAQCKYCAHKADCADLEGYVADMVGADFDNLSDDLPEPGEVHPIDVQMAAISLIEEWCKGVRAEVERRLFAGEKVPDWKLVEGKKGNRKWSDETEAENTMRKMRLPREVMFNMKLKTPSQLEKELKKDHPIQWNKLTDMITQAEGKPSVAPAHDKRKEYIVEAVIDGFDDITNDDLV